MSRATLIIPVTDTGPGTEPSISLQDGTVTPAIDLATAQNGDVVYDFNDDYTGTDLDRAGIQIAYSKFAGNPGLDINQVTGEVFISDVTLLASGQCWV